MIENKSYFIGVILGMSVTLFFTIGISIYPFFNIISGLILFLIGMIITIKVLGK